MTARRDIDQLEDQITSDPLYGPAMAFVLGRLPEVRQTVVLEVGCGCGQMCVLFALNEATVIGVDVCAEILHDAYKNAEQHGVLHRCYFIQGAAECLPLPDSCVDVVYSRSTLQYMDRRSAVREFQRVLRPGGSLVLIENLPFNPILLLYRMGRRLLSRKGPRREYVRSIRGYVTPREIDALGGWFRSTQQRHYHLMRMLSLAPLRPAFVPEILDRLLARADAYILKRIVPSRLLAWFVAAVYVGLRKDHRGTATPDRGTHQDVG